MNKGVAGILASIVLLFPHLTASQPANDNCAAASVAGALQFLDNPDSTLATIEPTDPVHTYRRNGR